MLRPRNLKIINFWNGRDPDADLSSKEVRIVDNWLEVLKRLDPAD